MHCKVYIFPLYYYLLIVYSRTAILHVLPLYYCLLIIYGQTAIPKL
jgi:hypothetical protein